MTLAFDLMGHSLSSGYTLIEASAGTGKTYSITWLVARLLLERELDVAELLIVTFTIAATEELDHRIRGHLTQLLADWPRAMNGEGLEEVDESRLSGELKTLFDSLTLPQRREAPARLQRALDRFDLAQISTIHGFCNQLLKDYASEAGVELGPVQTHVTPLLEEISEDYRSLILSSSSPDALRLMTALSKELKHQSEDLVKVAYHLESGGWASVLSDPLLLPVSDQVNANPHLRELARASLSGRLPPPPQLFEDELPLGDREEDPQVAEQSDEARGEAEAGGLFKGMMLRAAQPMVEPEDVIAAWDHIGSLFKYALSLRLIPALTREDLRESLRAALAEMNEHAAWKGGGGQAQQEVGWVAIDQVLDAIQAGRSVNTVVIALYKDLSYLSTSGIVGALNKAKKKQNSEFFEFTHPLSEVIDDLVGLMAEVTSGMRGWFRWGFATYAQRELPARKQAEGWLSTNDLIHFTHQALLRPDGLFLERAQARFSAALIDEFQDTDPIQWGIFDTIFTSGRGVITYLIGDPKQSIYRFRGADLNAYLAVREAVPLERIFTMSRNFRSDPRVLDTLNQHFDPRTEEFKPDQWGDVPAGSASVGEGFFMDERVPYVHVDGGRSNRMTSVSALRWRYFDLDLVTKRDEVLAEYVAEDVCLFLSAGHLIGSGADAHAVTLDDIGILTKTNHFATLVAGALARRGIASTINHDASVFKTPAAAQLERFLRAMLLPEDEGVLRAALANGLLAMDARDVRERADELKLVFTHLHSVWLTRGLSAALQRLLHHPQLSVVVRGLSQADGARDLSQMLHAAERVQARVTSMGMTPELSLQWLRDRRLEVGGETEEEDRVRPHVDSEAVKVVTVHRSKGLEYPVLFCPDLWLVKKARDDDVRVIESEVSGGLRTLDLRLEKGEARGHAHQQLMDAERREERRLLYVALTRAVHHCSLYLSVSKSGFAQSPLFRMFMGAVPLPTGSVKRDRLHQICLQRGSERFLNAGGQVVFELETRAPQCTAYEGAASVEAPLTAHLPSDPTRSAWRISSFTSLSQIAQAKSLSLVSLEEEPELDEVTIGRVVAPLVYQGPLPPLLQMSGSARFGQCLHALLQRLDFETCDQEKLEHLSAVTLRSWGFDDHHAAQVSAGIWLAIHTPLATSPPRDGGFAWSSMPLAQETLSEWRLRDLPRLHRRDEVQFELPLSPECPLNADLLNRILRLDPACRLLPQLPSDYQLQGMLRGSIDLLFRAESSARSKYYMIDYKTHWLGDENGSHLGHYHPDALHSVMSEHLYLLQSHLYQVVLFRLLRERMGKLSHYASHFGGVYFLFLRGMAGPESLIRSEGINQGCAGVYLHHPPAMVTELLSIALEDPREAERRLNHSLRGS